MTNYERIQAMSIDELAKILASCGDCSCCIYKKSPGCEWTCREGAKKWLESEAANK